MKTRAFIIALSATVLLVGAGSAFAYGGHGNGQGYGHNGMGMGSGMGSGMGMNCPAYGMGGAQLTPEQQQAYTGMMRDFENKMIPLREKASAKRMELDALAQNPNTKPETLSALVRELTEARTQMQKEQLALRDQMDKSGIPGAGMGMMSGNYGGRHGGGHGGGHRGGNW